MALFKNVKLFPYYIIMILKRLHLPDEGRCFSLTFDKKRAKTLFLCNTYLPFISKFCNLPSKKNLSTLALGFALNFCKAFDSI